MNQNTEKQPNSNLVKRPPIVVVMGHVDHGKTSILDYIRKSRVADKETGGITQHIGAYEIEKETKDGEKRKITFIDTPGHEAFSKMRGRGARVADIAVLVIAADEGFKPQTKEALAIIKEEGAPFIVAANKIDKPNANPEIIKKECGEKEIYIEEWGGEIPFVPISAKTGEGIDDLLETILLISDIQNLQANMEQGGEGMVIESHLDKRRGNTATLIIKNGTLKKGMFIAAGGTLTPVKIFENFLGKPIDSATFSSPVLIVGFNALPPIGEIFLSFNSKIEAENYLKTAKKLNGENERAKTSATATVPTHEATKTLIELPILLKADTLGSLEAVRDEVLKLVNNNVKIKIIAEKTGEVSEDDIKFASAAVNSIVLGFNISENKIAKNTAERMSVSVKTFNIIYKLVEWLREEIENRAPVEIIEENAGQIQILKLFKKDGGRQIAGGKVISGKIIKGGYLKYSGQEQNAGAETQTQFLGKIVELEKNKVKADEVKEGNEFGAALETKKEIKEGDIFEIMERKNFKKKIY